MPVKPITKQLRVALIQSELVWQDAAANRACFTEQFSKLREVDLVVLPETFNSGFSMQSNLIAEEMTGATVQWLQQQAMFYQWAICGSVAIKTAEGVHNRMLFVHPDGTVEYYDKKHLFRMANEHQHYVAGACRKVVQYKGFRLMLQVCYDLRFPVFARNRGDYDVLIYVANWPQARRDIWCTLLAARAMENQAYVLGCNRVGKDDNGIDYSGDSQLLDYVGKPLAELKPHQAGVLQASLDLTQLQEFRQKFPAMLDADDFSLL